MPHTQYPVAPHPFFSGYLFRSTRRQGRAPSFCRSVALDGTDGRAVRALPPEYGKGNSVYGRYAAWRNQGVWPRLLAHLQAAPDRSAVLLDSPIGRAHASAAGAPKNKEAESALGRSRGGFGTQIPILADRRGRPLHLRVTGGQPTTAPRPGPGWKTGPTRPCPA